jgi:hypothetical protein
MTVEMTKPIQAHSFDECMSQEYEHLENKFPDMGETKRKAVALNVCRKKFPETNKAYIIRLLEKSDIAKRESLEPLIIAIKKSLNRKEIIDYCVLLRQEGLTTPQVAGMVRYKDSWVKKYVNPKFNEVTELEKLLLEDHSKVTFSGEIRKTLCKATVINLKKEKREFEAWMSAEVKDSENEIITVDGIAEIMPTYMKRGGTLLYGHSNRPVGKVLKWDKRYKKTPDGSKVKAIWVLCKVFNHYQIDDEAWKDVQLALKTGKPILSLGATPTQDRFDCEEDECHRVVEKEQIYEISITELGKGSQGANPEATAERAVKAIQSLTSELADLYLNVVPESQGEYNDLLKSGLADSDAKEILLKDVFRPMVTEKGFTDTLEYWTAQMNEYARHMENARGERDIAMWRKKFKEARDKVRELRSKEKDKSKMTTPKEEIKTDPPATTEEEKSESIDKDDLTVIMKEIHGMLKAQSEALAQLVQKAPPPDEEPTPPEDEEAPPPEEEEEKEEEEAEVPPKESLTLSKTKFLEMAKTAGFQLVETSAPQVTDHRSDLAKRNTVQPKKFPTDQELIDAIYDGTLEELSQAHGYD